MNESGSWFLNISEIEPDGTAILGGDRVVFYSIHSIGLFVVIISVISCASVIYHIISNVREDHREKWEFSDRLPLYLALCDGLWGIFNFFTGDFRMLLRPVFYDQFTASLIGLTVAFFFGYQHIMNSGLCLYTYLKFSNYSLSLGTWEWKLHTFAALFVTVNLTIFWYTGAYGNSGYWYLAEINTFSGKIMALTVCLSATIHASATLLVFRMIKYKVKNQKNRLSADPHNISGIAGSSYHSTAGKCLTTFVHISLYLYWPMAVAAWIFVVESFFGVIDPFVATVIVILANSGGWVNAWGYYRNKQIKRKYENRKKKEAEVSSSFLPTVSSN